MPTRATRLATAPPPPPRALRRDLLPGVLLCLLMVLTLVPLAPRMPNASQDSGWELGLSQAVAAGMRFGRDVVFNLGPMAAVYAGQYHPATDRLALAGAALIAAALVAGLLALVRDAAGRWWLLAVPALAAALPVPDAVYIALPLLLLSLACLVPADRASGAALLLLAAASGLLLVVKFTFGLLALPLLALAALALWRTRRRRLALLLALAAPAGMVGFWLAAGQALTDLPIYLARSKLLVDGYTEAGSLAGPIWDAALYLLGAAALLALTRTRAELRLGLLLTLFLAFKSGFVRHDTHAVIALGTLALAPLLLRPALPGRRFVLIFGAAVALLAVGGARYERFGPAAAWAQWQAAAAGGIRRLTDPGGLARDYAADLTVLRRALPLPPAAGPTDIYPGDISALIANGLDWSPRPALQSVTAFSAALAEADRAHLAKLRNALFGIGVNDARLPALEDGASWPGLLGMFAVRAWDPTTDRAWLERVPGRPPAAIDPTPLFTTRFRVGRTITLPALPDGLLWATLDLQPTRLGRLAAALFRPPIVWLRLGAADRWTDYRLLPGPARIGFLLGPVVENAADFLALHLPERGAARLRPDWLIVRAETGTGLLWQRDITLTLHRLTVPPAPGLRRLLLTQPVPPPAAPPAAYAAAMDAGPTALCALDSVDGRAPQPAMLPVRGSLTLSGWMAAGDRSQAAALFVRLVPTGGDAAGRADGAALLAPVTPSGRPDVAAYLGAPALRPGLRAALDLSGLAGSYRLSLIALKDGRRWTCHAGQDLQIAPAADAPTP